MACLIRKLPFQNFLCCCNICPENVCCIIGCTCFVFAFNRLCNLIPFFCLGTAIPHAFVMLLFAVGGGLLIGGIAYNKPILLLIFPWIMIACMIMVVVYGILIYVSHKCFTSVLFLLFSDFGEGSTVAGAFFGYVLVGVMAGIDFVFALYAFLLISCIVTEVFGVKRDGCDSDDC